MSNICPTRSLAAAHLTYANMFTREIITRRVLNYLQVNELLIVWYISERLPRDKKKTGHNRLLRFRLRIWLGLVQLVPDVRCRNAFTHITVSRGWFKF